MKKTILTSLVILIAAVFTLSNAQSLDDVLAKHFKATGQAKLAKIEAFHIKVKVSQMGMDIPMEMKLKDPGKFRLEMDIQGQKMIQAFDGDKGWMIMPMVSSEIQDLAGDQLKQAQSQADLEGELYNYKEKGSKAELIGKVREDDKAVYRIKLTREDGNVSNYFIDAETYLAVKVKSKINAMGQTVDVEQRMSDYKDFDGIKMAMKMESDSPMGTATILLEEVILDAKIDDSVFARPEK